MERYKITQSLLSAWQYMYKAGGDTESMNTFLSTLKREKEETTEAMQKGIDFENEVYQLAKDPHQSGSFRRGAVELAHILKGAQIQVKCQRGLELDGMNFLVYGILDGLKEGVIYDVKYKTKSFGSIDLPGAYFDSPQHPTYFYLVPEARRFSYLVSDGEDVYIENYTPEETRPIEELISQFKTFLYSTGLIATYKEFWAVK